MSFRFPLLICLSGVLLAFCALAATSCSSTSNGTPESSSVSETTSSLLPAAEGKTEYPLTLTSPYDESVIDKRPTRVATVGANAYRIKTVKINWGKTWGRGSYSM